MEKLRIKYDRFIRVTAIRLDVDNTMYPDLYQVGIIALWEAESKYDESKGTFHTFLMRYITYEMMDYLTQNAKTIRVPSNKLIQAKKGEIKLTKAISMNTPINGETGEETIEDLLGYEEEDNSLDDNDIRNRAILKKELSEMNPQYQKIIWMYSVLDMTFQEIGDEIGTTKENIRQQYNKGIKILREKLTKL